LVSVGREDDVKFAGLCEARGIPVLRIGVTDNSGELEIQDVATFGLEDLRTGFKATLPSLFG
jgi:phosphoribosylformylglycinamidine synthase